MINEEFKDIYISDTEKGITNMHTCYEFLLNHAEYDIQEKKIIRHFLLDLELIAPKIKLYKKIMTKEGSEKCD